MTTSDAFLIRRQDRVTIQNPDAKSWIFEVAKNGHLEADFLQTTEDLSVLVRLQGEEAKCQLNCVYFVKNSHYTWALITSKEFDNNVKPFI